MSKHPARLHPDKQENDLAVVKMKRKMETTRCLLRRQVFVIDAVARGTMQLL